MSDVLIQCDNVGKKFCRDLKKSLWYGVKDSAIDLLRLNGTQRANELRVGEFWANKDISFTLKRGECLGLVGRNGAGKTTLLKILNGLIKPDQGHVAIHGRVGALIALGAGFNPVLTGRENVFVNGLILGFSAKRMRQRFDEIVEFSGIENAIDSPVRTYSSGMAARLGFAIAAFIDTDLLLIDEVLAVGDITFRMKCYELLRQKIRNGAAVILVSHNEVDLARVCQRGVLLEGGMVAFSGDLDSTLRAYQDVRLSMPENDRARDNAVNFIDSFIEDASGHPVCDIATHDDVALVARVRCSDRIGDVRILFHVDDARLGRLCSASTACEPGVRSLPAGESEIRVMLPRLSLLHGSYRAIIDVYGPRITDFYGMSPPVNFHVTKPKTDPFGFGMYHSVHLNHVWQLPADD